MHAEILPVPLNKKAAVINYIREITVPELIKRDYSAEQVLLTLHRIGIWYAKPDILDREFVYKSYIAYYAGVDPMPTDMQALELKLLELKKEPQKFTSFCYYLKGNYRILGCFAPNPKLAKYVPETAEYFTGAIPLQSRDYQSQSNENQFYKYMSLVCSNFDNRFAETTTKNEIGETIADFYFWGMVMGHPFIGGNHRAFDRFIEYAFAKKGLEIYCPLNDTFNIPNDNPLNKIIYGERRRLLSQYGLENQKFNIQSWEDLSDWLTYQYKLNDLLFNNIGSDRFKFKTEEAGQSLLNWG